MISEAALKRYSSLLHKKHREEEKAFIIEGEKLILEALESGKNIEVIIAISENVASENLLTRLQKKSVRFESCTASRFKKLTDTVHPQGIIAVVSSAGYFKPETAAISSPLVLYLNNINDPGNMGTILRTAGWFGLEDIILSPECVEIFNPKVVRSAMGAIFKLNFYVEIPEKLKALKKKGYKILVSDMDGDDAGEIESANKTILVMNNEAHGADTEIKSIADSIISVPGSGKAESLNVAVSAGILLYELSRKI